MSDTDNRELPQKVIISYRLLPDASLDSFERWSKEIDQPQLLKQPAVRSYQVLKVDPGEDTTQPQFIEEIEIESRAAWDEARETEEVRRLLKQWETFCDPGSVRVIYTRQL